MKIVEELLRWSDTLPTWQSDAVRRIWINNELDENDEIELFSFLKENVGLIPVDKNSNTKLIKFSKSDIGSASVHGQRVILKSLHELENVNAIPPTEKLEFSEEGLTVIYGNNAAGKSGYSRVLKKSCRARGTADRIYPNIYNSTVIVEPPKAKFTIAIEDDTPTTIQWEDGHPSHESLGNIAVFDSQTARVYVDDTNDVSYIPYGLDIFTKLALLCRSFRIKIQAELDALPQMPEHLNKLIGQELGIKALSINTTVEEIDKLAPFTENDQARLDELTTVIANYKANDPTKKAQELRRQKSRIDGLRKQILLIANVLSTKEIASIKKSSNEVVEANEATRIASEEAFSNEPLGGTGGTIWKTMFDSAMKFSQQEAYVGKPFPVIDDSSLCVLCQQPLEENAKDRMNRFWQFIEADTSKKAEDKSQALKVQISKFERLEIDLFIRDPQLFEEIFELSPETVKLLKTWLADQIVTRTRVLEATSTNIWDDISSIGYHPSSSLSKLSKKCESEASKYEKLADIDSQKIAESELATLTYRKTIQENKELMLRWIDRLKVEALLREALRAVDTAQITKKGSSLMEEALTQELENSLNKEFEGLGVEHLKMKFQRSGSMGSTFHQLQLESSQDGRINLSEILSEGEHRVVAIASFFAELSTSNHKCGIVFDDPVSSLDHYWRTKIAKRLVIEAKERQVVVFTHDVVFLLELEQQAKEEKVELLGQSVFRSERSAGLISNEVPWAAKPTKARVGILKQIFQDLEKLYKENKLDQYNMQTHYFYGLLRETWERAIEEVLFNKSVMRFRQSIETKRISAITIETQDIEDIDKGMTKSSKWMTGHDKSPAIGSTILQPKELKEDLDLIDNFRVRIEKRRQGKK